ncbi:MAG: hypothetical protein C5B52_01525 [Bacteroidetes bacterium]|nr:MAG: hypothetical protein C5B52_01525 [Bacteroidota bacterium]
MPDTFQGKHETKVCPRCGKYFECKMGDIQNCQCFTVQLSPPARDMVSEKFDDCLCNACLKAIQAEYQKKADKARTR